MRGTLVFWARMIFAFFAIGLCLLAVSAPFILLDYLGVIE